MLPSLFIGMILLAFVIVGCGAAESPVSLPEAVDQPGTSNVDEDIPVEALPDPLPSPFLFRDEVTIEPETITETIYVVQPGDTLATIAGRFCLTVEEVQRLNNIVDIDSLDVGQEIRIPIREGGCGAAAPETSTEPSGSAEPTRLPGEIYIVERGDTLADIGFAFGFTWVELMEYNGLTEAQAANLQIGQALIIPPPPTEAEAGQEEADGATEPPG